MANSMKSLMIVLGLKANDFKKELKDAQERLKEFKKSPEATKESIKAMSGEVSNLRKELRAKQVDLKNTQAALQGVSKGMAVFGAAVLAGAGIVAKAAIDIEGTQTAFENLAKSNGQSADAILKALQKASAGTIAAKDLMLSANRAMTLGVARNSNDFVALMEIARDRARVMGLTTTKAFDDIVTGIGRGSPLILDNLGLVINQTEANEKYARSIGKVANDLTEAEKQQALLNEVIRQGQATINRGALATLNADESLQALKSSLKDLAGVLGQALVPAIKTVTGIITDVVRGIQDWSERNPELSKNLTTIVSVLGGFSAALGGVLWVLPKIRAAWLALNAVFTATPIGLLLTGLGLLTAAGIYCAQNWETVSRDLANAWDNLKIKFAELMKILNPFAPAVQAWADEVIESAKTSLVARDANARLSMALKQAGTSTATTIPIVETMTDSLEAQALAAKALCDQINATTRAYREMQHVARTSTGQVITGEGGGAVSIYDQNAIYNMLREGRSAADVHAKYDQYHGGSAVDDVIQAIREGQWGEGKGTPYPGLAMGGTVLSSGMTWVGERGPELLHLPKGATVAPSTPMDFDRLKSCIIDAVHTGLSGTNLQVLLDGEDITSRVSINLGKRTLSRAQLGGF